MTAFRLLYSLVTMAMSSMAPLPLVGDVDRVRVTLTVVTNATRHTADVATIHVGAVTGHNLKLSFLRPVSPLLPGSENDVGADDGGRGKRNFFSPSPKLRKLV